jgi:hypothetical protein
MRRLIVKIIQILDGTPAKDGTPQRGQSVVEMALITPLLIVLFASMVEIGWFANNYLTLLDVTRAGARRGTTLQDSLAPLAWDNRASHVPIGIMDDPGDTLYHIDDPGGDLNEFRANYRNCPTLRGYVGFYNEVACLMLRSLTPLTLNDTNIGTGPSDPQWRPAQDDIVVSAFAIEAVPSEYLADPANPALAADVMQAAVVGRYPTNANECEVDELGNQTTIERDPFDFNDSGTWDVNPTLGVLSALDPLLITAGVQEENLNFEEVAGFDVPSADDDLLERHVGFVWFGNHRIAGTGCIGSEWTIEELERVMNAPAFLGGLPNTRIASDPRDLLPSQGVVLVEIFWDHRPLLNLPFFEPIFRVFRDRTTITVWALFPLPAVEPFIQFP